MRNWKQPECPQYWSSITVEILPEGTHAVCSWGSSTRAPGQPKIARTFCVQRRGKEILNFLYFSSTVIKIGGDGMKYVKSYRNPSKWKAVTKRNSVTVNYDRIFVLNGWKSVCVQSTNYMQIILQTHVRTQSSWHARMHHERRCRQMSCAWRQCWSCCPSAGWWGWPSSHSQCTPHHPCTKWNACVKLTTTMHEKD